MRGYTASSTSSYRYGFNGKEDDTEAEPGWQDYGSREYDKLSGRFISVDPLTQKYPWYSPYQFAGNKPIWATDLDGMEEWMKTQQNLLQQGVQLQLQIAEKQKQMAAQKAAQALANQPIFKQADNSKYAKQRSNQLAIQNLKNQIYSNATASDPFAAGVGFGLANTPVQMAKAPVDHSFGIYYNIKDGNYWGAAGNAALLALDVSPFFLTKGTGNSIDITLGMMKNGGATAATAAKTGAPFYTEWANLGIYNPSHFEGCGGAFKFVTDKVIASKGTVHFELSGLNIQEALAGDANIFVGRYTSWELQQVISDVTLFKNTSFYLNGVKQTTKQLSELGIKAPK
ncbi:RHS repeat domain-containing protein [Parafilimonas terrae]|uniref:RHS repeat-associated core domain-containing protein n=1 Tax=Parafilimonas terrae TaxID=1465490 RepID=A0A1I5T9W1_9BACT|nr:RHS repeat-associated core domain-containing protein [Parafilimonas terrae]SFP79758.1 RHS repeat-associated core domain-containing protein [Parafilimonas terrae]